jgi:hypothetical protein
VILGGEVRAWRQPPFRQLPARIPPPTDGVQHRVLIYMVGQETWAHVEVYGIVGYAVLLADISDARFSAPYVWGQNPTRSAIISCTNPATAVELLATPRARLAGATALELPRAGAVVASSFRSALPLLASAQDHRGCHTLN